MQRYPSTSAGSNSARPGAIWAVLTFLAVALFSNAITLADGITERADRFRKEIQPLLTTYCFTCHADGVKKGNVSFDEFKTDEALLAPLLWQKALKNLRAGVMPPAGNDRPTADEMRKIEAWIKRDVFAIDNANPDPGRVTLRRLNRTEYHNTIRDLMGYDFDVTSAFPQDDTGQGFDNIASVLNISPMLLDKYMQAADKIVKAVVPDTSRVVPLKVLTGRDFVPRLGVAGNESRDLQTDARVNIGIAAKYPATVHIDQPGEYRIRAFFAVIGQFAYDRGHANITLTADGEQIYHQAHVWEDEKHGKEVVVEITRKWEPGDKSFNFEVEPLAPVGSDADAQLIAEAQAANAAQARADQAAAAARLGAAQPTQQDAAGAAAANQDAAAAVQDPAAAAQGRGRGAAGAAGAAGAPGGGRRGGTGTQIALRIVDVRIEGPLEKSKWVHPPNYERFFTKADPPTDTAQRRQYAADILKPFASRGLRRPVDDATLNRLVNLAEATYTGPDKTFEQGIQQAMIALLASPRFLFRVEDVIPAPSKSQTASLIDEYALASRLSYLLWSSMPDEELFQLAQRGELRKNLDAQVKRMLADPRGSAIVENFSGQWLRTREVDTVAVDDKWVLARDAGTEAQVRADDEAAAAAVAARRGGRGFAGQQLQGQPQQGQPAAAGQQAPNQTPAAQPSDPAQPNAAVTPEQPNNQPPQGFRGGRGGRGRGRGAAGLAQTPSADAQLPQPAAPAPDPTAALVQQAPAQAQQAAPAVQDAQQSPAAAAAQPPQANQAAPQDVGQARAVPAQPNQPVAAAPDAGAGQAVVAPPSQPVAAGNAAGARGQRGNRGAAGAGFAAGFAGGRRGGRGGSGFQLDKDLRTAMRQETEMYFGYILHEDRSVLELIDSNYTFLNERLAKHYGIAEATGVTGPEMRRVELPADSHRGGILTQGSVLTITSQSTRTSAVKRGLFLLENILGTPPPPPPPNIPALEDAEKSAQGRELTLRETLEIHRENPLCASCHARMDPLGLALENFNALGMWRTKERGQDIKVEGELVTGEKLASVDDLRKLLVGQRRADFYRTLTQKFMIYALGRDLDYYDVDAVDQIVDRLEKQHGQFSALLMGVIESAPFQMRREINMPVAQAGEKPQVQQTDAKSRESQP